LSTGRKRGAGLYWPKSGVEVLVAHPGTTNDESWWKLGLGSGRRASSEGELKARSPRWTLQRKSLVTLNESPSAIVEVAGNRLGGLDLDEPFGR